MSENLNENNEISSVKKMCSFKINLVFEILFYKKKSSVCSELCIISLAPFIPFKIIKLKKILIKTFNRKINML